MNQVYGLGGATDLRLRFWGGDPKIPALGFQISVGFQSTEQDQSSHLGPRETGQNVWTSTTYFLSRQPISVPSCLSLFDIYHNSCW